MNGTQAELLVKSFKDILDIDVSDSQLADICDILGEDLPADWADEIESNEALRMAVERAVREARGRYISTLDQIDSMIDNFIDEYGYESANFYEMREYYLANRDYFDNL